MLERLMAAEPRVRGREVVMWERARSLPGLPIAVDPECLQRGEPRIDLVLEVGLVTRPEARAARRAQTWAVRLAQRRNRLGERDGLSGKPAEVQLVVVRQARDVRLGGRVEHLPVGQIDAGQNLLVDLDGGRDLDLAEAAGALAVDGGRQL